MMFGGFFDFFKRAPKKMSKGMRRAPGVMMDTGKKIGGKAVETGQEMPGKMVDASDKMVSRDERKKRRGRKRERIRELEEQLAQCREDKECPPCGAVGVAQGKSMAAKGVAAGPPPGVGPATGFGKKKKRERKRWGFFGYNPYFSGWK